MLSRHHRTHLGVGAGRVVHELNDEPTHAHLLWVFLHLPPWFIILGHHLQFLSHSEGVTPSYTTATVTEYDDLCKYQE